MLQLFSNENEQAMLTPSLTTVLAGLHGGRILRPDDSWDDAPLHVQGSVLADAASHGKWLDARDCLVLPGIVDFHGDAFERQIMPRPGVHFPLDVALLETDRQLAGNGITTALHGITYSWEGGLRGRETAEEMLEVLARLQAEPQARLRMDHRVHLRFECHNVAGEAAKGIARVALDHGIPVSFGIITADNLEQAIERAGTKSGNKGRDAALTAIEMANLLKTIGKRK